MGAINQVSLQLLDAVPDAMILVRRDGKVAFANLRAIELFGYGREELHGLHLETLLPQRFREVHAGHRAGYFGRPVVRSMGSSMELYALHKDGTEFPVEISLSQLETDDGPLVCSAVRDVSERKRAENELRGALAEVAELKDRLAAENVYLKEEAKEVRDFEDIVGDSAALHRALSKVEQVAGTDATVLLLGETGTGKELIAHAIHERSPRKGRALIKVNCAALPSTLIESELFGHERGAFTGAFQRKAGRFELADGGTIFLDEIGDLSFESQAKLLRVLQDGEFERLGSTKTQKVDVRVIAATNRGLDDAIAQGEFRQDLYYRLRVFPIEIPPLRERREDIPLLVWYIVNRKQADLGKSIESIPREVMDALVRYDWPGNVRELENVIERAMILSPGSVLTIEETFGGAAPVTETPAVDPRSQSLSDLERAHVLKILGECGWKIKGEGNAADRLGLKPSTLRSRMKRMKIERPV